MSLPDCGSCCSVVHSSGYKGGWVIVLVLVQALQKLASIVCMAVVLGMPGSFEDCVRAAPLAHSLYFVHPTLLWGISTLE